MIQEPSSNLTETDPQEQQRPANVMAAIAAIVFAIPLTGVAHNLGNVAALGVGLVGLLAAAAIFLLLGRFGPENRVLAALLLIAALVQIYGAEFRAGRAVRRPSAHRFDGQAPRTNRDLRTAKFRVRRSRRQ